MELKHEEIDELGIRYRVYIEQDDIPVRGNAMASGDDKLDKKVEDGILKRLNLGQTWAWASVKVEAYINGFTGTDYLGCCSYKNTQDFIKNSMYYSDMKHEAKGDLLNQLNAACETLKTIKAALK